MRVKWSGVDSQNSTAQDASNAPAQNPSAAELAVAQVAPPEAPVLDPNTAEINDISSSGQEQQEEPPRGALAEWAITILLLLFLTTTLVQAYVIPTGSMEDTLMIGDHL